MARTKLHFQTLLFVASVAGCATHSDRAVQRNQAIIHCYFEEWANRGDAAVADQLIATNLVLRNPPAVIRSLEDYKNGMAKFHAAFPDARYWL